jgi:hypothetical protein
VRLGQHLALQAGRTTGDQGRPDLAGRQRRKASQQELVTLSPALRDCRQNPLSLRPHRNA